MGCGRQDKKVSAAILLPTGWQARRPNLHNPQHFIINSRPHEQYGGLNSPIMPSGLLRQFGFFVITKIFFIIRCSWSGVVISFTFKTFRVPYRLQRASSFAAKKKKNNIIIIIKRAGRGQVGALKIRFCFSVLVACHQSVYPACPLIFH